MNIPMFDQSKIRKDDGNMSLTLEAEAIRLSNELRAQPSKTIINVLGERVDIPAKWGFDCETAPITDFKKWLNDTTIKKSESLFWFVIRIMALRFPTEHNNIRNNLTENNKIEFDLILSELRNETEFLCTGFSGMVRFDKTLTNENNRIIKTKDDNIKIVRK